MEVIIWQSFDNLNNSVPNDLELSPIHKYATSALPYQGNFGGAFVEFERVVAWGNWHNILDFEYWLDSNPLLENIVLGFGFVFRPTPQSALNPANPLLRELNPIVVNPVADKYLKRKVLNYAHEQKIHFLLTGTWSYMYWDFFATESKALNIV